MLNVFNIKGIKFVSAAEFYDYINSGNASRYVKSNYAQWCKRHITHRPDKMAVELRDYVPHDKIPLNQKQYGRGYKRKDYMLTIAFLQALCLDIKSPNCREVRDWASRL